MANNYHPICSHNRRRYDCKECYGKVFCEHDRRLRECSRCCPEGAYKMAQRSAKKRQLTFELTLEEFTWIVSASCSFCGDSYEPMTCDRVDSTKGYRFDNSQPLCHQCNMLKKDLPDEVFLNGLDRLRRHIEKMMKHQSVLKAA